MVKFIGIFSCFFVFFFGNAMEHGRQEGFVFANHTDFSYTADASCLRKVGLFRWNEETKQKEKIEHLEIAPGIEKDFMLCFENHGDLKDNDGNLIDYGKIIVCKSGESGRHMIDVTFKAKSCSEYIDPFIIGGDDYVEYVDKDGKYSHGWLPLSDNIRIPKGFVDEQKEFAVTNLYMPKKRKWGKHFVFSVEKYEEGKETYIDLDQFLMDFEELEARDRKRSRSMEKNIGCCGFFSKKRSGK
jgi:hypothetical protein